jgi:hypothetical protein
VVFQKFPSSVRRVHPGELPEQNRAEIMDFQGFLEAESRKEKWTPPNVRWEPHSASNCCGTQITSLRGCGWYHGSLLGEEVGDTAGKKRTRPSAQYTANGLASPGH